MLNRVFIDTRSESEVMHTQADGLKAYPYTKAIANLDAFCEYCSDFRESEIVFVCRSGRRSKMLKKLLAECDFNTEKVTVMRLSTYQALIRDREIQ
jgi:rhodanese-related sulfurtransferase